MEKIRGELSLLEVVRSSALAILSLRGLLDVCERCQIESKCLSSGFLKGQGDIALDMLSTFVV